MFTAAYTDERLRFLDHPWAGKQTALVDVTKQRSCMN
jgi:hypothetical protein